MIKGEKKKNQNQLTRRQHQKRPTNIRIPPRVQNTGPKEQTLIIRMGHNQEHASRIPKRQWQQSRIPGDEIREQEVQDHRQHEEGGEEQEQEGRLPPRSPTAQMSREPQQRHHGLLPPTRPHLRSRSVESRLVFFDVGGLDGHGHSPELDCYFLYGT